MKGPKDGHSGRPVFVIMNNKRKLAISDGNGNCYDAHEDLYCDKYGNYDKYMTPENILDPKDYEFERGLSGFDF